MSARRLLEIGDRVRTPRNLEGTVTGFTGGRARVRYDQLPPDTPADLYGGAKTSAFYVLLSTTLLTTMAESAEGPTRRAVMDDEARPYWSEAEDERLRRDYPTLGAPAVAAPLGRSIKAVRQRARSLGLVRYPNKRRPRS